MSDNLPGRVPGSRCCYLRIGHYHHPDYFGCDCLRTELPAEAQALASAALGLPDRNHTCPACSGAGWMRLGDLLACCPRCAGCGERKANREPADHAFPGYRALTDRAPANSPIVADDWGYESDQNPAENHAHEPIKKPRVFEKTTPNKPPKTRGQTDTELRRTLTEKRARKLMGRSK